MVKFLSAGKFISNSTERVFLTSKNRKAAKGTIMHNNDYSTVWSFPNDFFRANFLYEPSTGIYRTNLRYYEIEKYSEIIEHNP